MRNIETRITKTGPDDAGLNQMLTDARMEERRARAAAMAARLDRLACHITSRQLNHVEAAELCVLRLKTFRTKHRRSTDG
ncbi:hypothetical protein SEEJ0720_16633 [Salmonella enterica subsp. enterica serovar Javiana str. PRS_2010_0720]|nr:hypothetical protein SEEJ0720_16633 [Salmonella enterica subsp. enterica serovar Javiana str. PRS_2010_0720]